VKISCPACSAKYSIADDKVQERLAKIRCRKCGATIVIDGKTSPPNVYTAAGDSAEVSAPPAAADSGTEYSIDFGEGDQRNMGLREIVTAYKAGQITTETYVWAEGFSDWKPLSEVPELVSAVSGGGAGAPSPWDARPTAQRTSQLPRTTQAARNPANRPSGDLFGGVSRAGNEDDVATSAPEQPSGGGGSGTGARNESSVLFSLSALTAGAQNQRPSARPPAVTSSKDDSGLIDLKALTAAAVKSDTGAMAMPAVPAVAPLASPLGVPAPLGGFGSPLGGGIATGSDIEPKKSKTPIIIAALLCVGMLAVAAAIVLKPAPPPPPAPVVIAAPPAPTPTPEPIAAAPPATGTAEAAAAPDASAKPAPIARGGAPRSAPRSSGKSTSTSSGSSTKKDEPKSSAPAAPKSSNCGCGPADLQCAMRCAAKKK
jgi:predicted Zn finger-like uncharacterized protein